MRSETPCSVAGSPRARLRERRWRAILVSLLGLLALSCGGGEGPVRVFAAASLQDVMPLIVERYRAQHAEVRFELSFGGSQVLATQIVEGAPADLFIAANRVQAQRLLDAGLAGSLSVIARNRLVLAVREDAPWQDPAAVAAAGARLAAGAPGVPVRDLTDRALALLDAEVARRLRDGIVTEDPSVRVVLSRVELGEADAAFVYETDLAAARGLRSIALPREVPANEYVAVLLTGASARAAEFQRFLDSDEVRAVLSDAGFITEAPAPAQPATGAR